MRSLMMTLVLVVALPAAGLVLTGGVASDLRFYAEFPPRTRYVDHRPFSLLSFTALLLLLLLLWRWYLRLFAPKLLLRPRPEGTREKRWPLWGTLAAVSLALCWLIAWTRIEALSFMQHHTFVLVWLSYIALANAVLWKRTGRSPLTHQTLPYLSLFPLSAVFWWSFEFLNRFTQNWFYQNVEHFSPAAYALLATLSFSTVLPAITVTAHLLASELELNLVPSAQARRYASRFELHAGKLLAACALTLFLLPAFPNALFPVLWVTPPLLIVALRQKLGEHPALPLPGTAARVCLWALAGLACGVLWEMWNYFSLARWVYYVPAVQAFHLFEMPLLGYAGYLPFGIFGALVVWTAFPELEEEQPG